MKRLPKRVPPEQAEAAALHTPGQGDRSRFVGRAAELDRLGDVAAAAHTGTGRLVVVAGEPGVGRTRLVSEFGHRVAAAGVRVAWGSASEDGSAPPFLPWEQVLAQLRRTHPVNQVPQVLPVRRPPTSAPVAAHVSAAISAGRRAQSRQDKGPLADHLADLPEIPELPALLGQRALWSAAPDPVQARLHLHEAIAALVLDLVDNEPTVVVLEDLQRWDIASLQLLGVLTRRLTRSPLLVVATLRDLPGPARPGAADPTGAALSAVVDRPATERMVLRGLGRDAVEELVATRWPDPVEPQDHSDRQRAGARRNAVGALAAALYDRTDGNPYFVGELLRLVADDADPVAAVAAAPTVQPDGIRQVLRRRLRELPTATRGILLAAAVVGHRVDPTVAAATADISERRFLELTEPAVATGLLREEVPGRADRLRFANALVAEVVEADASGTRRARLHARAGRALLDRGTDTDAGADAARVAHHFFHARPVIDAADALSHVLHAADQAERVLAYQDCEVQLRRALHLIEAQRDTSARASRELSVQMRLGRILAATRGYTDIAVHASFDRAHVLSQGGGQAQEYLPALWGLFTDHHVAARFDAGREVAVQLGELARRSGNRLARLAAAHSLGALHCHLGPFDEAGDHLRAGVKLAEDVPAGRLLAVFPHHPGVLMRGMNAVMAAVLGDHERARNTSQRAVATAEAVGHPFSHILALYFDALVAVLHDDPEWTLAAASTGARLADENGAVFGGAVCAVLRGWAEARLDMADETGCRGATDDGDGPGDGAMTDAPADPDDTSGHHEADTGVDIEVDRASVVGPWRIQAALASLRQNGVAQQRPLHFGLLADAWRSAGRTDLARSAAWSGLASAEQFGEVFYVDRLRRLTAELDEM